MKMNRWNWKPRRDRAGEAGQAIVFVLLILGIFLLGALCFAFDLSNIWFHRQSAQSAADAACAAGAMDILVDAQGEATGKQGFTLGTDYSCTTTSTDSVCKYAAKNGYNSGTTNTVSVKFPNSSHDATMVPPGVAIPPSALAGSYPFVRVDIVDHVQTFFIALLSGSTTKDVRTFSTCGVEQATAPIPMLVLDPQTTDGSTLSVQGTPDISIYGGPQQSIQVDSINTAAVNIGGSATIDLSKGGPSANGSNLGVYGGPTAAPGGFVTTNNCCQWMSPTSPISDPFAQLCAPGQSSNCTTIVNGYSVPAIPTTVLIPTLLTGTTGCATAASIQAGNCNVPGVGAAYPSGYDGCPLTAPATCVLYTAGAYPGGIAIGPGSATTAIFDPGLYYVTNGLALNSNSTVRPGTGANSGASDGSGGTVFYFVGTGTVSVSSNSGKNTSSYTTSNLQCTASSTVPPNLPATITVGNVLVAPCSGYYGDPQGTSDSLGEQRNMLFFQDRSATGVTAQWGGGGQFLLAGTMYFHACIGASPAVGGVGCTQTASTKSSLDLMTLGGNAGSGTYILGQIISDQIQLQGTPIITMDLNPTSVYSILKASIFQ
jgi:Flp pilus assembly protein TadG